MTIPDYAAKAREIASGFYHPRDELLAKTIAAALLAADTAGYQRGREDVGTKAREFAGCYPPASNCRNTFIILAEWAESDRPTDTGDGGDDG